MNEANQVLQNCKSAEKKASDKSQLQEVKQQMKLHGTSIKEWSTKNGYSTFYVYRILTGKVKGYYGTGAIIKRQLKKDFLLEKEF